MRTISRLNENEMATLESILTDWVYEISEKSNEQIVILDLFVCGLFKGYFRCLKSDFDKAWSYTHPTLDEAF